MPKDDNGHHNDGVLIVSLRFVLFASLMWELGNEKHQRRGNIAFTVKSCFTAKPLPLQPSQRCRFGLQSTSVQPVIGHLPKQTGLDVIGALGSFMRKGCRLNSSCSALSQSCDPRQSRHGKREWSGNYCIEAMLIFWTSPIETAGKWPNPVAKNFLLFLEKKRHKVPTYCLPFVKTDQDGGR